MYVRPGQDVNEAVSAFYNKINAPVLTDITLDLGGIRADQIYPAQLPDLFAGTQLVVAGRYREGGATTITLTGTANGREQTYTFHDQAFRDEGGEAFIPRLWATRAIGHLMQQIRLNGENPELVQSIVNLSTRYGVITLYTSFLIEEDDILNQTAGMPAIEEAAGEMLAAPASVSGQEAVDRAAVEGALAAAEAPLPMATMAVTDASGQVVAQAPLQIAGGRTFFLREGVWIDSAYDPAVEPQTVTFASEAYFELLDNRPELGQALALGDELILMVDGQAYRITVEGGETEGLTLPESTSTNQNKDQPAASVEPLDSTTDPAGTRTGAGFQVCGLGIILPLMVAAAWRTGRRHKRGESA